MDVALTQRGTDGALLTITDYLRLAPHQRPTRLWCAGTATHGPCQGPAFPKAVTGAAERGHHLEPRLLGRRDRALAAGRRPRGRDHAGPGAPAGGAGRPAAHPRDP